MYCYIHTKHVTHIQEHAKHTRLASGAHTRPSLLDTGACLPSNFNYKFFLFCDQFSNVWHFWELKETTSIHHYQIRVPDWSKFDHIWHSTCIQWKRVLYIEPENGHINVCSGVGTRECSTQKPKTSKNLERPFPKFPAQCRHAKFTENVF